MTDTSSPGRGELGPNAGLVDEMYRLFQENPQGVSARWREFFADYKPAIPVPETPAPVRFLPEYDNALLGHADRTRIIPKGRRIPLPPGDGARLGTILLDGMLGGEWHLERERDGARATIVVEPYERVDAATRVAIEAEGLELLGLIAPDREPAIDVREPNG